jgi:hypothetical protein
VPALCFPGGSVKCSQMPRGLFTIVRQLGASSSSPDGSVKVFTDARGGLFDRMAVRC